ncbi:MAG: hypothetical protein Kow0029_09880 [Candidatus Rifleibacteriota bacterium]
MNKRLSMSLESYLETIADLQDKFGAVRTSDLADKMGCKRSSVTNALQRLSDKGLINYQAYRPVTLTLEGQQAIDRLNRFHEIIELFLQKIFAFPKEFAREEACRLEHRLSFKTIERMNKFMKFIDENKKSTLKVSELQKAFAKFIADSQ